jgi:acyl-CoA reductase-like NAD-dependent aldehyde dehydrogenase
MTSCMNRFDKISFSSLLRSEHIAIEINKMAYQDVMDRANAAFQSGKTKNVAFRRRQLEALLRLYEENREEMAAVLAADLRRPKQEAMILEVDFLINDMNTNLAKLDEWTAVTKVNRMLCFIDPKSTLKLHASNSPRRASSTSWTTC